MGFPPGDYRLFVRTEERGRAVPDAEAIQGHFEKFGEVLDVYRPPSTPDICYVTFGNEADLQVALGEPRTVIAGLGCNVQQAMPRGSGGGGPSSQRSAAAAVYVPPTTYVPPSSNRIYVTGVGDDLDSEVLQAYFSYFGSVKDVYIPVDRNSGQRKPFAFVTMSSGEECQTVLQSTTHHVSEGISVNVMHAEPRDLAAGGKGAGPGGYASTVNTYHSASTALAVAEPAPRTVPVPTKAAPRPSSMQVPSEYDRYGGLTPAEPKDISEVQQQPAPQQLQVPMQGVPGPNRLFVFGMQEGLNADMLRGHFARHGELLDVYVPHNKTDIGFITFSTEEELEDALQNSGLRIAGYYVKGMKAAEQREKGAVPKGASKGASARYRAY
mmetsp:Transcript_12997/g.37048  ORF Transcript_12997/g.37048 Transcript_12997/m.37048 type:complete len:382 (+) Transcript_12997:45-1190(+)